MHAGTVRRASTASRVPRKTATSDQAAGCETQTNEQNRGVRAASDRHRPLVVANAGRRAQPGVRGRTRRAARDRPGLRGRTAPRPTRRRADRAHLAAPRRPRRLADPPNRRSDPPADRRLSHTLARPAEPDRRPPSHRHRTRSIDNPARRRTGGDRRNADRRPQDRDARLAGGVSTSSIAMRRSILGSCRPLVREPAVALETRWKRPGATRRKTLLREISLNVVEPALSRDP